jgi:hypothetical protein
VLVGGWGIGAIAATVSALGLRDPATMAYMANFWTGTDGFPPLGIGALVWVPVHIFSNFAHFLLFLTPPPLVAIVVVPAMLLAIVGLISLARKSLTTTAILLAPIIAGVLGAVVRALPFEGRTGLYAGSAVNASSSRSRRSGSRRFARRSSQ